MLLAFACHKNFLLYQMDVKSAFLNGFINEEYMLNNLPGLEVLISLIMFLNSKRHFMA